MAQGCGLRNVLIDKNGVHADDQEVEKVKDAIPPTSRKELRSLRGLASYYRGFIPGFAKEARPLNEKTSDKVKFVWSEEMQDGYEELKVNLTFAPVLAYLDYGEQFAMCTDASSKAIGDVRSQADEDGRDHRYIMPAELCLRQSQTILRSREELSVLSLL